jgi:hypothetical protein
MNSPLIAASGGRGDNVAPSTPKKATAASICQTTFTLNWLPSTDNVAVTGYKVYEDGVLFQDVGLVTTKAITSRTAGSSADWTISAYDAAGNDSGESPIKTVVQGVSVISITISDQGNASRALACGESQTTFYTDGLSVVQSGDILFNDSCAQNPLNGNGDFWSNNGEDSFQVSSVGVITSIEVCL